MAHNLRTGQMWDSANRQWCKWWEDVRVGINPLTRFRHQTKEKPLLQKQEEEERGKATEKSLREVRGRPAESSQWRGKNFKKVRTDRVFRVAKKPTADFV